MRGNNRILTAEVANMRLALLALAMLATGTSVAAQTSELLPLPTFTPCASKNHPSLPAKWEAVALMQDFFQQSVTVGRFVYAESATPVRFSLVDPLGLA